MFATSLKKVSQSAAVAAFGVAMVAAVGAAPASAVSLQQYSLDLDWGNGATASGYYYVDQDQLPVVEGNGFGVSLLEWDVSVKQGTTVLDRFYNTYIEGITGNSALKNTLQFAGIFAAGISNPATGGSNQALSFTNTDPFKQLTIQISTANGPFTGAITPGTKILANFANTTGPSFANNPNVTASSTAVPEPITLTGTAVAGVMGLWMKRKQKAAKAA